MLQTVGDVANDLLGHGGVLGVAPVIAETVDNLIGKGGVLDGLIGGHGGNVVAGLANTTSEVVESLVGKGALGGNGEGGVLSILTGGHGGILSGLLGTEAVAAATNGGVAASAGAAPTQHIATTEAHISLDPMAPSNMFEAAHTALQLTEGVANAITPILTFVGQPIVEDDGHTDPDHSINISAHHAA